jgi:hypothetical protein
VRIALAGNGVAVSGWRHERRRYWHGR